MIIELRNHLENPTITSKTLLSCVRFNREEDRQSPALQDSNYLPFYFHLAKYLHPDSLLEFGMDTGIISRVFLRYGERTVKHYLGFQENDGNFYSPRLAIKNIRDFYREPMEYHIGQIDDKEFLESVAKLKWELIFINDLLDYQKCRKYMELAWDNAKMDGHIIVNGINLEAKEAFFDFCKVKNRDPITLPTRYGTGIIQV